MNSQLATTQLLIWLRENAITPTIAIPALLVAAAKLAATDPPELHERMITILRVAIEEERKRAAS
jgi:hypothetical protein